MYGVGPTPTPKIYQNNAIFDNGNFKVYWSYNSSADSLYFTLDVAAVGWIGFGFSENNIGMNRYDVAVGGVRNGQMYLQVCFEWYLSIMICTVEVHYRAPLGVREVAPKEVRHFMLKQTGKRSGIIGPQLSLLFISNWSKGPNGCSAAAWWRWPLNSRGFIFYFLSIVIPGLWLAENQHRERENEKWELKTQLEHLPH